MEHNTNQNKEEPLVANNNSQRNNSCLFLQEKAGHTPSDYIENQEINYSQRRESLSTEGGEEYQVDLKNYNFGFILSLTLTGAIGGLCLGYDTGVIGGAAIYFNQNFPSITKQQKEQIVSIAIMGAAIGSSFSGTLADRVGRRPIIILSDVIMIVGSILMAIAGSITALLIGRFVIGIGIGIAAMVCNVYLAEVSPFKIRGAIMALNIVAITLGQCLALFICVMLGENWRLMLGIAGVPALVQLILMKTAMPESPEYLMKKGENSSSIAVVKRMFSRKNGQAEFAQQVTSLEQSHRLHSQQNIPLYQVLTELFTVYRKNFIVGITLQTLQQMCGINTIMYYGPFVLKDAGFGTQGGTALLINSLPLGIINFVGTTVALYFSDRKGRRYLMLRFLPLIIASMVALSYSMYLVNYSSYYSIGQWTSMISICLFLIFFSIGLASQPWAVCAEIFPIHVRGVANSATTTANWIGNYVVSALFLTATSTSLGKIVSYMVIAFVAMVTFFFVFFFVPETKGKTLEECVLLFMAENQRQKEKLEEDNPEQKEEMTVHDFTQ